MTKINENLKALRKEMNLSQKDFGDLIGKSANQINAYETGRADIPASIIYKIAEVTSEDITWLMTGERQGEQRQQFLVYNEIDRKAIVPILVANGYDVGQHKQKRTDTGKNVDYYIHYTDTTKNCESTR